MKELNQEINFINKTEDDGFLRKRGVSRGTLGEIVIVHGAACGKSKHLGEVVNLKAIECPIRLVIICKGSKKPSTRLIGLPT
jgi:hypothetical protein